MYFLSLLSARSWATFGAVIALSALLGWGYFSIRGAGVAACEREHRAALVKSIQNAETQAREIALQDAEVLQEGAVEREHIRTVYRDRETKISKYIPADCNTCRLSPYGIKLLNDALSNAATTPANPGIKPDSLSESFIPDSGGDATRGFQHFDSSGWKVL